MNSPSEFVINFLFNEHIRPYVYNSDLKMFSRCLQVIKSRTHLGQKVQKYSSSAFPALIASKRKNNKSGTNILPKNSELFRTSQNNRRHESSAAMLFSVTKVLVGAGSLVGLGLLSIQWFRRRDPKQLDRITRRLHAPLELDFDQTWSRMDRSAETRFIRHLLSSSPSSLLIAVGPSGSGKSNIIKQVLSDRKMTLYVDFKRDPIMNGEEFMFSFLENAGYYVFVPTDFTRLLFRDGDRRGRVTAQDAEKALSLMLKVLRREKERGWPAGVPVICLDDYHRVYKNGQGQGGDPFFNKFLDWCLHVEECKLAHIIFITSYASAQLDLDAHPHVRSKRVLLFVDYPAKEQIKKTFSELLATLKDPPNQHETEWIMRVIGGHMEDLDLVYTALLRGDSYANILRRLVTDSIGYIEDQLENILQKASMETTDEGKREAIYNKYLRLWSLMEMLRDSEAINRRDLIRNIFKENTDELDEYVAAEIICYRNIRKEYIKPAAATADPDNNSEANNKNSPATTVGENKTVQKPADESAYISLLNESLDSVLVSAGSPRLRVAFDVLLKDKRLLEQKQMVEVKLRLKKYTDRLTALADQRKVLLQEHQTCVNELEKLVTNAEKWRQEIGADLFSERKEAILVREDKIEAQLKTVEDQIEENTRKKEEQTLQQNVLTNAIATPVQVTATK